MAFPLLSLAVREGAGSEDVVVLGFGLFALGTRGRRLGASLRLFGDRRVLGDLARLGDLLLLRVVFRLVGAEGPLRISLSTSSSATGWVDR